MARIARADHTGDRQSIERVNEVLHEELHKRPDFRQHLEQESLRNGRVWRVFFSTTGKDTVVHYFNDDTPREYRFDIPPKVADQLVEVVRSHEQVPDGEHRFDVALFYDQPVLSVAID